MTLSCCKKAIHVECYNKCINVINCCPFCRSACNTTITINVDEQLGTVCYARYGLLSVIVYAVVTIGFISSIIIMLILTSRSIAIQR